MVHYSLVKTAADESGDRQLAREAQWLRELAVERSLEGQVPRLLEEGRNAAGRRFLMMSVAQGTGETRAFTVGHERFLASLGKARFRSTDFEVTACCAELNQSLEMAGRVADFLELGELLCRDALAREESCGGHFREEHQTPDGEAQRDDARFCHAAVWEWKGDDTPQTRHEEPLVFENVHLATRSYK